MPKSCQLTFLCPKVVCIFAKASASLQYTADWSAVCNCTLSSYSAARLLMLLWRCRCASVPDACLPRAGVGTDHRGSHCLLDSVVLAWTTPSLAFPGSSGTENRRAVHLGLPKSSMRFCLRLLLSSSPLVISGFFSWNFSRTHVASMVLTQL